MGDLVKRIPTLGVDGKPWAYMCQHCGKVYWSAEEAVDCLQKDLLREEMEKESTQDLVIQAKMPEKRQVFWHRALSILGKFLMSRKEKRNV